MWQKFPLGRVQRPHPHLDDPRQSSRRRQVRESRRDLYYAADAEAGSVAWTLVGTFTPSGAGARVISATYTLPAGNLQAVRARFRYNGSASPCGTGSYNDHDDLVFPVQ